MRGRVLTLRLASHPSLNTAETPGPWRFGGDGTSLRESATKDQICNLAPSLEYNWVPEHQPFHILSPSPTPTSTSASNVWVHRHTGQSLFSSAWPIVLLRNRSGPWSRGLNAIQPSCPLSSLPLLPSILPIIRVFSNESALCIRWPKHWSFNFSINSSNEQSELISFAS